MKPAKAFAAISFFLLLTATGLRAACTSATAAGTFGFTTTGTLILPTGPAPVAAVSAAAAPRAAWRRQSSQTTARRRPGHSARRGQSRGGCCQQARRSRWGRQLKAELNQQQRDMRMLADPAAIKRWLKRQRQLLREAEFDFELF